MKTLIIFVAIIFSLSGCFKFESQPFPEKDLKPINQTKFGKEISKALSGVKLDKQNPLSEVLKGLSTNKSGKKVMELNNEQLVMQEKKDGLWQITTVMKNSTHLFVCMLGENKEIKVPQSLKTKEVKDGMMKFQSISGPSEEMKQFALKLVGTSQLVCGAFPYISDQVEKTIKPWWKFW